MKTYGSAVLTALQAQHMSIENISQKIQDRQLDDFFRGDILPEQWLDCFWKQMAILEVQRCRKNICRNN